ncbi:MAG: Fpg/Nei family DNA glycosylase [Fimbriimonadaceae bacterium]|nr:Fpg/Nei family DNA glycosylase [Fimbriimonadaceae bacterium]QYK55119.1 MAG: Fpg/Nei family DNA glycosylase [Fimbriimonadaceae bacterium]
MPELPDIQVYAEKIAERFGGEVLESAEVHGKYTLKTQDPPLSSLFGTRLESTERLGKQVALWFEGERWALIHLMLSGRFRALEPGKSPPGAITMATFRFETGTLVLTEASRMKRASLHLGMGRPSLEAHRPSGLDPLAATAADFRKILTGRAANIKGLLTNQKVFAGVGGAYSDEILFAARVSPFASAKDLSEDRIDALHAATREVLTEALGRLRTRFKDSFPGAGDVTAFREEHKVHGRAGEPCAVCGNPVQAVEKGPHRETNYCPVCQPG